jgi:hypothetical protein
MDWTTIAFSTCSGGLAGAILNLCMTPLVPRRVQRNIMKSTNRKEAVRAYRDWTSKAYDLYMRTEVTWAGANPPREVKGTVADPEYLELLNEADISIKTAFKESEYQGFRAFVTWFERTLGSAFSKGDLLNFAEYHQKRSVLVSALNEQIGK